MEALLSTAVAPSRAYQSGFTEVSAAGAGPACQVKEALAVPGSVASPHQMSI
ncbi:hypothetical protein ACF9IK_01465 [Kitasatospora hibisci]|uniref:hypothetical protein n=1 Tax=Kitasatospora hibisci TaxID=3369522 RepID=UPI003754004A